MSPPDEREGGFLRGWSRRKLQAKQEQAVEPAPVVPQAAQPEPEVDDPDLIAALPSLDEITAGFDMTPFLARGVPAHLKNAALRRLWSVSPSVRDYSDPAVDYAWDWNAPGGVPGGGGVLSEQSVAKMVKDLIGKGPKVDEPGPSPEEKAAPDTESVVAETSASPAAVRRSAPSPAANPSAPRENRAPEAPEQQMSALSPRRHGGAVPE